jgi:lipopolysaccharide biosynthesis protein
MVDAHDADQPGKRLNRRALAFFLPQYHPIPENDRWWGAGFTEWRNVARARPLFPGHFQPRVPADLGFYDLRVAETREAQAALAREHGIFGFCYHHYWFHGRQLLDRPFREVLASGTPDFPFALCWANEPWTRAWDGRTGEVIVPQEYSAADDVEHIRHLLPAFADPRYVRVDGRPLFLVYKAGHLPEPRATADRWREEAQRAGVGDLYLCRVEHDLDRGDPTLIGFDAAVDLQPDFANLGPALRRGLATRALRRLHLANQAYRWHRIYDYETVVERMRARPPVAYKRFPGVSPSWDNTPRRRRQGIVIHGSTPERYRSWLRVTVDEFTPFGPGEDLVFLNAWNEWAEGNHLEPSRRWGRAYLEATRDVLVRAPDGGV